MKKPQRITLIIALLSVVGLFAATQSSLFGNRKPKEAAATAIDEGPHHPEDIHGLTTDSILYYAKQNLPQAQVTRLTALENSVVRGNVAEQKLHLYHQLAHYWKDSAAAFTAMAWYPFAWYTAEAARLENSEKTLSFAAHNFLAGLNRDEDPQVKHWEAEQAKDLFERSLKVNPNNDSSKVGLGAAILYGGLDAPMTGIAMIREVAQKDSTNLFAQQTLGEASLISGQLDKAVERFKTVIRMQPQNLGAMLLLADTYEKMEKWSDALQTYNLSLPLLKAQPQLKAEVEKRVAQLKTK